MASTAPFTALRRLFENRLLELSTEAERLFSEACERVRSQVADQFNQAARRMRQAESPEDLEATLADAARGFASGAAVFRVEGDTVAGVRIAGEDETVAGSFSKLRIPLAAAPALASAVQTREPVIAAATASEVSQELASLLGHSAESRVSIFPIVLGGHTSGLLYAWGNPQTPALELLAQLAAAMRGTMPPSSAALVQIETPKPKSSWDSLSPAEQRVHLRAQRFARVQVARMRLYEAEAVQAGRAERNLYGALRQKIDQARSEFERSFFAECPSMVDYLHLELIHTLANDDAELLGEDYPGPLV
jgi:DNA gyrase/topoisomerase IV subunit B